ncbi:MAG: zinc ribbon domain-containing protein [Eubacteriales bacterium]|jgi:DNA-directed RNA polymerase subunit M/transcription elongation factor TFIIS|nr:zinc ribbon domain-containing protein [Clostridiales bacterium]MDD2440782.1 zinc ribbon domain-containing protein [Eubacteriales bacterium]MDD4139487.1 zinc ribbon domain-containing protein [Eubacteriales bacterium]MDD4743421.1 zinc ribbon domain-containing protein [Eubacteriales bacterium]
MANDVFGGLGGLMKGLSGFMPQDDPDVQIMKLQSDVSDLKQQEQEIFAQIGRQALASQGAAAFGELGDRLKLVQINLAAAEQKARTLQAAKEAKQNAFTCPSCGHENPDGTKFCQECGTRLGTAAKTACTACGAELAPGTRFCGECGARQEG